MSAGTNSLKLLLWNVKGELSRHLLTIVFNMLVSWRQKCLLFTLLAFIVLSSEASRLSKSNWEQMMPKKLPAPSSSPSKGTNSVSRSSVTMVKADSNLPSSDGKDEVTGTELRGKDSFQDFRLHKGDVSHRGPEPETDGCLREPETIAVQLLHANEHSCPVLANSNSTA
ncbi:hypothetical protein NC651_005567 [Populus alba x Populus x berolinensis]|nr:hypothetical protein NC651_005567 [Populus alba x Populus x berolinensis]